jgi:hypothetical protein
MRVIRPKNLKGSQHHKINENWNMTPILKCQGFLSFQCNRCYQSLSILNKEENNDYFQVWAMVSHVNVCSLWFNPCIILVPICTNHFFFWFVQIDFALNSKFWFHPSAILKLQVNSQLPSLILPKDWSNIDLTILVF